MFTRPTKHRLAVLAISALTITACGNSTENADDIPTLGGSTDVTAASQTEVDPEVAAQEFVACLREEGFDAADPTLNDDGTVDVRSIFESSGLQPRSDDFEQVQEACGDLLQAIGGGDREEAQAARQEGLLNFTTCLRTEGLDVSDITVGGGPDAADGGGQPPEDGGEPPADGEGGPQRGGPGAGASDEDRTAALAEQLGVDPEDPAVVAAFDACSSELEALADQGGGPGQGGPPPGSDGS